VIGPGLRSRVAIANSVSRSREGVLKGDPVGDEPLNSAGRIRPPGPAAIAPAWGSPLARLVPYVFAVTTGFQVLAFIVVRPEQLGFDARLYADATKAWLTGGDPWSVASVGIFFAAPPPSMLPFVPFAFLPGLATSVIWIVGSFVVAAMALRSLRAPMWWLISWPIVDGCLVGNANVAVFAALVLAGGRFATFAPLAKIYTIAPLVGERAWRTLIVAAVILITTLPVLPWGDYLAGFDRIATNLRQVAGTTSIFGQPALMALAVIALLSLGIRRASWLTVPVLWPYTQPHYLAPSIPAMSPWLAIAWSFPHPLVVLGSLVIEAVVQRLPPFDARPRSASPT
jgi:hypothetical protein